MRCAGDSTQFCGAGNRLELYYSNATTGGGEPSQPAEVGGYAWFGCWAETGDGAARALPGRSYADDRVTLDACAGFCEGSAFFGAEYGRECYCGEALNGDSTERPAGECGMVCAGDRGQFCGAGDRLSVYRLPV